MTGPPYPELNRFGKPHPRAGQPSRETVSEEGYREVTRTGFDEDGFVVTISSTIGPNESLPPKLPTTYSEGTSTESVKVIKKSKQNTPSDTTTASKRPVSQNQVDVEPWDTKDDWGDARDELDDYWNPDESKMVEYRTPLEQHMEQHKDALLVWNADTGEYEMYEEVTQEELIADGFKAEDIHEYSLEKDPFADAYDFSEG
tara:strand:- start:242 stop:844 length:603 start_codon:yes stop_codon:yes gene_type:complete